MDLAIARVHFLKALRESFGIRGLGDGGKHRSHCGRAGFSYNQCRGHNIGA